MPDFDEEFKNEVEIPPKPPKTVLFVIFETQGAKKMTFRLVENPLFFSPKIPKRHQFSIFQKFIFVQIGRKWFRMGSQLQSESLNRPKTCKSLISKLILLFFIDFLIVRN